MSYREINEAQARTVLRILTEECGHKIMDPRDGDAFVRAVIAPQPDSSPVCREWRFGGALGFGGKFRNNGNNGNVPYVDCYPENETPARREMIAKANQRLAELFGAGP